jgi:replicative DNA helicase
MIDSSLLQVIKYKDQFEKVGQYIPEAAIDKQTKAIVKDVGRYFAMHPEEKCIDFGVFRTLFYTKWHKGLKDDQKDFFALVLENMQKDASNEIKRTLINNLLELDCATQVGNIVSEFNNDGEIDFIEEVSGVMESITQRTERNEGFTFATDEDCTIGEEETQAGFKWPLDCMNEHYRPIIPQDSYIIAASQGVGKTTFLANILRQAGIELPVEQDLVWLNNESGRGRIRSRVIQAVLQATNSQLRAWKEDGSLNKRYIAVMGRIDRVKIYDIHEKDTGYITDLLDGLDEIGAIVFDMLDNVKSKTYDGMREDQRLEQLYAWARVRGVTYNCPIFETSQVSREGDGEMFPEKHMLKDSKVGKQGACDGIVMIGYANDPEHENNYGISMPKTKSRKEGMGNLREVIIGNMDKAKYIG